MVSGYREGASSFYDAVKDVGADAVPPERVRAWADRNPVVREAAAGRETVTRLYERLRFDCEHGYEGSADYLREVGWLERAIGVTLDYLRPDRSNDKPPADLNKRLLTVDRAALSVKLEEAA